MKIIIGSRGSKLAIAQSEEVKQALLKIDSQLEIEIKAISTKGDRILDRPLSQIGDKGLFTQEIETRLIEGSIDLAVHSMKDMPTVLPDELMFCGTIQARDERDCLVFNHGYQSLDELPLNARVATGSLRRRCQLLQLRPDLKIFDIRGNVLTRLEKLEKENYDALVLASAGLKRLGLEKRIGYYFKTEEMVPACAQGILAIEVRKDSHLLPLLKQITDEKTTKRMRLERLFIETLECGCHSPAGGHISFVGDKIYFDAIFGNSDGTQLTFYHDYLDDDHEAHIIRIAKEMKKVL
ncbi:MAG: hydroxymethylbilane synthase [Faecalibacillus sp.]